MTDENGIASAIRTMLGDDAPYILVFQAGKHDLVLVGNMDEDDTSKMLNAALDMIAEVGVD